MFEKLLEHATSGKVVFLFSPILHHSRMSCRVDAKGARVAEGNEAMDEGEGGGVSEGRSVECVHHSVCNDEGTEKLRFKGVDNHQYSQILAQIWL